LDAGALFVGWNVGGGTEAWGKTLVDVKQRFQRQNENEYLSGYTPQDCSRLSCIK